MEAGLKQFIEVYAKDKNLTEVEVGMLAGAMSHEAIAKLAEYTEFVNTMNAVCPWLIQYVELAGKSPAKEGDSNDNS
jgi:hypothetical protein